MNKKTFTWIKLEAGLYISKESITMASEKKATSKIVLIKNSNGSWAFTFSRHLEGANFPLSLSFLQNIYSGREKTLKALKASIEDLYFEFSVPIKEKFKSSFISPADQLFANSLINLLPDEYLEAVLKGYESLKGDYVGIKNIALRATYPKRSFSYLPKGKLSELNSAGEWSRTNRQQSFSLGKILRSVAKSCNVDMSDDELRATVDHLKANNSDKSYLKVVEGDELLACFLEENYSDHTGELGTLKSSCMRHQSCQEYLTFYSENNVKMLVSYEYTGRVLARALLWETQEGLLMDRVYGTDAKDLEFATWAVENGYWRKPREYYNTDCNIFIDPQGNKHSDVNFNVVFEDNRLKEVLSFDQLKYPYLDTLQHLDLETGLLCYDEPTHSERYLCLGETDGDHYLIDKRKVMCLHYETERRRSGCKFLEYRNAWCSNNQLILCESTGNYLYEHDVVRLDDGSYVALNDPRLVRTHTGGYTILHGDQTVKPRYRGTGIAKEIPCFDPTNSAYSSF